MCCFSALCPLPPIPAGALTHLRCFFAAYQSVGRSCLQAVEWSIGCLYAFDTGNMHYFVEGCIFKGYMCQVFWNPGVALWQTLWSVLCGCPPARGGTHIYAHVGI